MFKRILVPLDGSPAAEAILPQATELARLTGAELVLLRVALPDEFPGDLLAEAQRRTVRDAEIYLHALEQRLKEEGFCVSTMKVRHGHPAEAIVDCAANCAIDLIAMSTHGRTGLRHMVMGSVAEKVLRAAPTPVFLVRSHGNDA